jgi:hypothetical protein
MISCVNKEILYQDTPKLAKVMLFATSCQAIDYTRCWQTFLYDFNLYSIAILHKNYICAISHS